MPQDSDSIHSTYTMATLPEHADVAENSSNGSFALPRLTGQHRASRATQAATTAVHEDDDIYDTVDNNTSSAVDDAAALSPTDGYFRSPSSDSNVWTRDPSLAHDDLADTKAREAAENVISHHHHHNQPRSLSSVSPYPQHSHNGFSAPPGYRRYQSTFSNRSPSQIPLEAPPAYTPSASNNSTSGSSRARASRYIVVTTPSSSRARSVGSATRSYSTFPSESSTMGHSDHEDEEPEESRGLLAGRRDGPESMADAVPDEEEGLISGGDGARWSGRTDNWQKRVPWLNARNCWVAAILTVLLTVGVVLAVLFIPGPPKTPASVPRPGAPKEGATLPGQEPGTGDDNAMDPAPSYPVFEGTPNFSDTRCKSTMAELPTQKFSIDFSQGQRLAITQNISETNQQGSDIHVSGDVIFRRAYNGGESSSIVVELVATEAGITPDITLSPDQHLVITIPRNVPSENAGGIPCLSVRVTAWVPPSSTIDSLFVSNIHLGVRLLADLSLSVLGDTTLNTIVAPIVGATTGAENNADLIRSGGLPSTYAFNSREIVVHTLSSPITGAWPLYDLLDLRSTSGSIHVGIAPKPADKDDPRPAVLAVKSTSGTIEVFEPVRSAMQSWAATLLPATSPDGSLMAVQSIASTETHLPPRDYSVTIETTSASIRAELAFSSLARIRSFSGTIVSSLLPVLPARLAAPQLSAAGGGWRAQLQTHTTSGSTVVGCLDPMWYDDTSGLGGISGGRYVSTAFLPVPNETTAGAGGKNYLHLMSSKHESTSGTVKAVYPASWEGDISLSSVSGSLLCTGDGVRIGKDDDGIGRVGLKAKKGKQGPWEASGIIGHTTSGDIRIEFPE